MKMGDAYIIVYSVTDKVSFEKASELRIQLRRARQTEDIPIILVGNKSDLVRSREVSVDGKLISSNINSSVGHFVVGSWWSSNSDSWEEFPKSLSSPRIQLALLQRGGGQNAGDVKAPTLHLWGLVSHMHVYCLTARYK